MEGYVKDVLAEQMGTSLFFATPRTKDVERRPCPTNTHTYTLFPFSDFMDVSRHRCPFVILIPLFYFSFSVFLWIQTGFEAKAAFVPSRFVHLPTNLPAATSNFVMTKKIYTDIELPKDDQVLLLQGFNDFL